MTYDRRFAMDNHVVRAAPPKSAVLGLWDANWASYLDHHELTGAIGVGQDLSWRQTAYAGSPGQVLAYECRQSKTGQVLGS